jgi:hypothetical protein
MNPPAQQPNNSIVPVAIQQIPANVATVVNNVSQGIATAVDNTRANVGATLADFSNKGTVNASNEFLNSNSIVAKFSFVILVLLLFFFLLYLGISLIGYFTQPSLNPYIIQGTIDGNNAQTIPQDPKQQTSAVVLRSNNRATGIEFSWSCWLFIQSNNTTGKYQHIFNKGDVNYGADGIATVNNAPGLYLKPSTNSECSLYVTMDTLDTSSKMPFIDINGIPMKKWCHVVIRLKNTALDVYVNGTVAARLLLPSVPKQNYNDVNVAQNGGYQGKLSNLRYYSYALSVFEINQIVGYGPNTSPSKIASVVTNTDPYYLSSQWFYSKM